jgi:hypothetical protein
VSTKKKVAPPAKASKRNTPAWPYRTSLRLPARAATMADRVVRDLGAGDRADVIRAAAIYGLEALVKNPGLIRRINVEKE